MEISRVKFHVLLTYNYDDKDAKRLLRMHKSILCGATQINLKVYISDVHNMHLPTLRSVNDVSEGITQELGDS